jgi:hypothetical protein
VIDRALQQGQVAGPALGFGALEGDQPHAPHAGMHLAFPDGRHPAAGTVAQLFGQVNGQA